MLLFCTHTPMVFGVLFPICCYARVPKAAPDLSAPFRWMQCIDGAVATSRYCQGGPLEVFLGCEIPLPLTPQLCSEITLSSSNFEQNPMPFLLCGSINTELLSFGGYLGAMLYAMAPPHLDTAGITVQRTNRQPLACSTSTQLHAGCTKHPPEQQPPTHAAPSASSVLGMNPTRAGHHIFLDHFQDISKLFPLDFPPVQVAGASLSPPLLCPYSRRKEKER